MTNSLAPESLFEDTHELNRELNVTILNLKRQQNNGTYDSNGIIITHNSIEGNGGIDNNDELTMHAGRITCFLTLSNDQNDLTTETDDHVRGCNGRMSGRNDKMTGDHNNDANFEDKSIFEETAYLNRDLNETIFRLMNNNIWNGIKTDIQHLMGAIPGEDREDMDNNAHTQGDKRIDKKKGYEKCKGSLGRKMELENIQWYAQEGKMLTSR